MSDIKGFFRKNGKIIPIRAAAGAAATAVVHNKIKVARSINSIVQSKKHPSKANVQVNKSLDLLGLGLSAASGAIAAATFSHGPKGLAAGFVASHAIDAGGIAANLASVAGKGHAKDRAKIAAKQEGRNFAIGNAIYVGGVLATKSGRAAAAKYTGQILSFARKVLRVA